MGTLVLLAKYKNINESYIVKGFLESEGIESVIYDENSNRSGLILGGIRLMVKETDYVKAKSLLETIDT